jgi:hypothetical protein
MAIGLTENISATNSLNGLVRISTIHAPDFFSQERNPELEQDLGKNG